MSVLRVLKGIWIRFLNGLNLYTRAQYKEQLELSHELGSKLLDAENSLTALDAQHTLLQGEHELFKRKLQNVQNAADYWKTQYDDYVAANDVNDAYVRDTMTQLHDVYDKSYNFGFPSTIPIPGSVAMHTIEDISCVDDNPYVCITGRNIVTDEMTQQLAMNKTMRSRINIILDDMERNGVLNRIARDIIKHGGAGISLAYNPNCTNYEMFYEIQCRNYAMDSVVNLDPPSVAEPIENPGESEES